MATKTQAVSAARSAGANTHLWLGLVLTPGLGPTRGRKLAEHCGGIEKVFQASLTELEAAGLQAHSAQSIATGKSQGLGQGELVGVATAGARTGSLDEGGDPPRP